MSQAKLAIVYYSTYGINHAMAQAAAEAAPETPRNERAGWLVHTWPTFASLARCDHESQTGKVCIVDSIDSPDAVTSYYGKGFTH